MKEVNLKNIARDQSGYDLKYVRIKKDYTTAGNPFAFAFNPTKELFNFTDNELDVIPEEGLFIEINNFEYATKYKDRYLVKRGNDIILGSRWKSNIRETICIPKPKNYPNVDKIIPNYKLVNHGKQFSINPTYLKELVDALLNVNTVTIVRGTNSYKAFIVLDALEKSKSFGLITGVLVNNEIELPDILKNKNDTV